MKHKVKRIHFVGIGEWELRTAYECGGMT